MSALIKVFLKIFFRNWRAWFFVIFLPAGLFALAALLNLESIIRTDLAVPYRDFLLIGIVSMALMQTGLYTVGYLFIDYKRTQVLKRLYITPLQSRDFVFAQIFSRFFIALIQVLIIILFGVFVFDVHLQNLWFLPVAVFFGSTLFFNFGIFIAAISKDYEEAAPYTTMIGLPLVFLGDVFFPVQNLPEFLRRIADFLPLKPFSAVLRHYLLSLPDRQFASDLAVLLVWFIFIIIIGLHFFKTKIYSSNKK